MVHEGLRNGEGTVIHVEEEKTAAKIVLQPANIIGM